LHTYKQVIDNVMFGLSLFVLTRDRLSLCTNGIYAYAQQASQVRLNEIKQKCRRCM